LLKGGKQYLKYRESAIQCHCQMHDVYSGCNSNFVYDF